MDLAASLSAMAIAQHLAKSGNALSRLCLTADPNSQDLSVLTFAADPNFHASSLSTFGAEYNFDMFAPIFAASPNFDDMSAPIISIILPAHREHTPNIPIRHGSHLSTTPTNSADAPPWRRRRFLHLINGMHLEASGFITVTND
jgi:hypothetical protein